MTVSCVQTEPPTNSYDIGRYEGRTLGKCSLYVFNGYSPILMIKSDDTLVFVNSKEDGEIEGLYVEVINCHSIKHLFFYVIL